MKVLVDTFPFIWLVSEPTKLSRKAKETFGDDTNEFFLSDASVLELSLNTMTVLLKCLQIPEVGSRNKLNYGTSIPLA